MESKPFWLSHRGRVTVALDAMGGDGGVAVTVEGAVTAAREMDLSLILVGVEDEIARELSRFNTQKAEIRIRHAPEVVEMRESPAVALRKKKDSSIRVGIDLVKEGEVDAIVSAGNTGAVMATSLVILGPLAGVERPAIAAQLPTLGGYAILLDAGANVDSKPRHLVQFAIMGTVYARKVLGKADPRVGLLGLKVVQGLDEAVEHIAAHSTAHSDGILTRNEEHAQRFIAEVDSAAVYVNASTRFTDGAQLGLGAEVAVSTQRLHARGALRLVRVFEDLQRAFEPHDRALGAERHDAPDPELDQLTAREREVLRLIARGLPYKQVARRLAISVKIVEAHVSAVLRKLQLSSRYELTRWASDRRLI